MQNDREKTGPGSSAGGPIELRPPFLYNSLNNVQEKEGD